MSGIPPPQAPLVTTASRPRVFVDTNALFLPFTRRFPLEREVYRLLEWARIEVPQSVLGELDRLVARGRPNARVARAYADRFPVVPTDLKGDAALETLARDHGGVILTADGELRRRLVAKGMKVLFPRGEKHLGWVQGPRPTTGSHARRHPRTIHPARRRALERRQAEAQPSWKQRARAP